VDDDNEKSPSPKLKEDVSSGPSTSNASSLLRHSAAGRAYPTRRNSNPKTDRAENVFKQETVRVPDLEPEHDEDVEIEHEVHSEPDSAPDPDQEHDTMN